MLRISSDLRLQWKHIDWKAGTVRLEPDTTKNGKAHKFRSRSCLN